MHILKILFEIIFAIILIIILYFVFMTITDYRPKEIEPLTIENNKNNKIKRNANISVTTWNLGYCGLDKGQDFFMDGGKNSRGESKQKVTENLNNITKYIDELKSDLFILQEVDIKSTRSYKVNQYAYLKNNLKEYGSTFAINYKVSWVPVPILKPHGYVKGGVATFSKYSMETSNRYQYPGKEKWPRQLAELDRCFIETIIPVEDGKNLVMINSHLSAYDKGGTIRKQQLNYLKNYIINEQNKGSYVIVGGDWNHIIPGTDTSVFKNVKKWPEWLQKIPDSFKPKKFKWVADGSIATNRDVDTPYVKGNNYLCVIDGFLVSDNVEVKTVKGHNLEFENTDHNPVTMEFILK